MSPPDDVFLDPDVDLYLAYAGMETDLIFTQGIPLPGFAAYPLLETQQGCSLLRGYLERMIALGREKRTGVILESPTWVANRVRGAEIGYAPQALVELNQKAIAMMSAVRDAHRDVPIVISANIGPRGDAYAPKDQMSANEAEDYHCEQISVLADTEADVMSGYTIAYPNEAIGIIRAAHQFGAPVVIAFTVETDGTLPNGAALERAVTDVDAATDGYAAYFMINCAHPDHFAGVLENRPWMRRIKGLIPNASRCSHAELENATQLDSGNPTELGEALANLRRQFPHLRVLGGCCGTDLRHMSEIAEASIANPI